MLVESLFYFLHLGAFHAVENLQFTIVDFIQSHFLAVADFASRSHETIAKIFERLSDLASRSEKLLAQLHHVPPVLLVGFRDRHGRAVDVTIGGFPTAAEVFG